MEGFDGQVFVPKPNPLFNARKPVQSRTTPASNFLMGPSPLHKNSMLEQQQKIAERIRMNKLTGNSKNNVMAPNTSNTDAANNTFDNFLDSGSGLVSKMNDSERARILQSKSKYEIEANAELFAKSRNVLSELEKKELSHEKRNAKKRKNADGSGAIENNIVTTWVCKTCKRTTRVKPGICIRQNHVVKRKREIKKKETVVEKRMGMRTKSISDGGMILGAGLDWSGWNGC